MKNKLYRVVTGKPFVDKFYHAFFKGTLVKTKDEPVYGMVYVVGEHPPHSGTALGQTVREKDLVLVCEFNDSRNKREGSFKKRREKKARKGIVVVDIEAVPNAVLMKLAA
jgi:hypothetical protein